MTPDFRLRKQLSKNLLFWIDKKKNIKFSRKCILLNIFYLQMAQYLFYKYKDQEISNHPLHHMLTVYWLHCQSQHLRDDNEKNECS